MGNPEGPKPKAIPSWRLNDTATSGPSQESISESSGKTATPNPREPLLKQATKFLENEDIQESPIERKRIFLESKGLTEHEILDLLQEGQEEVEHGPEAEVMEDYGIDREEISHLQSTKTTSNAAGQEPPSTLREDSPQPSTDLLRPTRDVPPIITYPEFLIHSKKAAPLITARSLLTVLYVASGAAATIYGSSKYIVEPMIESLTAARHSLFETASGDLDTLNSKLESAVSKIPAGSHQPDEDGSDGESVNSDPARFFNRSTATQTSPHLSRSTSSISSEVVQLAPSQLQENSVKEIYNRLTDIQSMDTASLVKISISDLRKYLDGLPRVDAIQNGKLWEKPKSDEYTKLKAEIRGVKGVLLSARNFPSSAAVR